MLAPMSVVLPYAFVGSVKPIARVVLKGMSGVQRLGSHALRLEGSLEMVVPDSVTIAEIGGHVAELGELERYALVPDQAIQPFALILPLTRDQLRALEEKRLAAGGEVDLGIRLVAQASGLRGLKMTSAATTSHIGGAAWIRVLSGMAYADAIGFDVAIPRSPEFPELSLAREPYARACACFHRGDHHGVVATCREVLQALETISAIPSPPPASEWNGAPKKSWTIDQRVAFVSAAVRHLAHLAHHPGSHPVPREVAHMTLVQTALLLRTAHDRLCERNS